MTANETKAKAISRLSAALDKFKSDAAGSNSFSKQLFGVGVTATGLATFGGLVERWRNRVPKVDDAVTINKWLEDGDFIARQMQSAGADINVSLLAGLGRVVSDTATDVKKEVKKAIDYAAWVMPLVLIAAIVGGLLYLKRVSK